MRVATLVGSVKAALHLRSRQYESRISEAALRKNEKLVALGRLAASIAHEINNPLEAVTNLLYLLKGSALDAKQQQYLDSARQELARVSEITAQTLNFNRQCDMRGQAYLCAVGFGSRAVSGTARRFKHCSRAPLSKYRTFHLLPGRTSTSVCQPNRQRF